jgi:hypothetical protein
MRILLLYSSPTLGNGLTGTSLPGGPTVTPKSHTRPVSTSYTHPCTKISVALPGRVSFAFVAAVDVVGAGCGGAGGSRLEGSNVLGGEVGPGPLVARTYV